jgi:TMEM175 potassium channel family protein
MEGPPRYDPLSRSEPEHRDEAGLEFGRVVAFSDGVFAIAITLLVLTLEIPPNLDDLGAALRDHGDDLFAYAISFAVIGKFWLAHHRFYGAIQRFDGTLMALNLFYLGWIVLVPFSTDLLGNYSDEPASVIIYAFIMAACSATFVIQIVYAYRLGLVRPEARAMERRYAGPANFLIVAVFVASMPVALLSPTAAELVWLAIFLVGGRAQGWLARRLDRR